LYASGSASPGEFGLVMCAIIKPNSPGEALPEAYKPSQNTFLIKPTFDT
jgi:hypothetical protein